MPIYEYQCEGCQQVFEVRQKISDPAPASHTCGSTKVRRILSATTFVLKGTGWYKTDYADKKPQGDSHGSGDGDKKASGDKPEKSASKESSKDTSTKEGGSGAKSEAKPKAASSGDSSGKAP